MLNIPRWKVLLIVGVCLFAVVYAAPNLLPSSAREKLQSLPGWMPTQTVNLGLDLRGGAHLLLEVDVDVVVKERGESLVQAVRSDLRDDKIGYTGISATHNGMRITARSAADTGKIARVIRDNEPGVEIDANDQTGRIEASFTEAALNEIIDQTVAQSIEIVRRRVDETGTREPLIQRQGEDRIVVQIPGLDDPARIRELLGKTAKLTFHLVDTDQSSRSLTSKMLPTIENPGIRIAIHRTPDITGDMLNNAQAGFTEGAPVVNFQLNSIGGKKFCKVSTDNVGRPFAIVLDDEIISTPNFREPICGGQAQISGSFSVQEANDLALLLRAGALPAPLTVLEERSVGPSLGADSVTAGKEASVIALILTIAFMAFRYRRFGIYADIALLMNVALLFALLSMLQATLTLPGIAGIVLTIGMAVDANVLIFERIREELKNGRSVAAAVDAGYKQAMSTIIDANVTTLIAAAILYSFGSGPIKGFAVTLTIGIVTSLFSAIFVTRLLAAHWVKTKKPKELKI